jgi:hypothetical protein
LHASTWLRKLFSVNSLSISTETVQSESHIQEDWREKVGWFSTASQLGNGLEIFSPKRRHHPRSRLDIASLRVVWPAGWLSARALKINFKTVALWRKRFCAGGADCLWVVVPGRGRKARLSPTDL